MPAGDNGEDVCNEFKVLQRLQEEPDVWPTRRASERRPHLRLRQHRGAVPPRQPRLQAARGRACDGHFDHKTGKGHVKGVKGCYHDALFTKRNRAEILLHENFGGGFSPPSAHKIRRLGRAAKNGTDRTPYRGGKAVSYVSFHTRDIAMANLVCGPPAPVLTVLTES